MIGFHGCDAKVAHAVITGQVELRPSVNNYDWLGHGIYFGERSPSRAMQFAIELKQNKGRAVCPIEEPAVVGAVLDLGHCLDLSDYKDLQYVKFTFSGLSKIVSDLGASLPKNLRIGQTEDLLLRELDCAVLEYLFKINDLEGNRHFDSVRSPFIEGDELYPDSGFRDKNHIQICIRNTECIKAYFRPRNAEYIRLYSMS
ncbi:hypothetical protein CLV59_103462 [Chitinophaga dinghuensis]|uniref:DUF3990 domain-containing protein n=1 Tax=Chitinophaga dinghuensis TaxID=1539050 RepID=A0A327W654_9BACT|nr:hypothetical protein [Chitinophaga dinghuensis]RAJ83494.1 hypothetical protein CLV59_103462 [Chitinophaga dinghuensis]